MGVIRWIVLAWSCAVAICDPTPVTLADCLGPEWGVLDTHCADIVNAHK